ncbi:hypothetical protein BH11BAC2_BH11BAC2_05870 [soil metagenome]
MSDPEVINNKERQQFEIRIGEYISKIPYTFKEDMIALFHTEVPEELRNKGLATKLTLYALNFAKDHDLKILPYCPFIAQYIKDHPQWEKYVK